MSTLIMWHNRFSENENEAVEAHIPRHRDSKTKKPRHRDSKTKKPRHRDSKTKKPRHRVPVEFWPLCPLISMQPYTSSSYRASVRSSASVMFYLDGTIDSSKITCFFSILHASLYENCFIFVFFLTSCIRLQVNCRYRCRSLCLIINIGNFLWKLQENG